MLSADSGATRTAVGFAVVLAVLAVADELATARAHAPSALPIAEAAVPTTTGCSAREKRRRATVLRSFMRAMPARRAAYFRTHKNAKARKAFVKQQTARLTALRRALARCASKPPPAAPRAPAACSPALSPGFNPQMHEGPTDYALALQPLGEIKAAMIFVDFSDAPQSEPTQALHDLIAPKAVTWYRSASYGAMSLAVTPTHRWFRMPKPSSAYGFADGLTLEEHRQYIRDALVESDPDVDYSQTQILYVVSSRDSAIPFSPAFHVHGGGGVTVDGREIRHSATFGADIRESRVDYGAHVLIHETGHLLGLPDLYDFSISAFPNMLAHAGGWDPMSWVAPGADFLAWHKWKLGWLQAGQLRCLTGTGSAEETLTPVAAPGGVKAVIAQTSPTSAYVIEARARTGNDSGLCDEGVLVYSVDASVRNGSGPVRVRTAGSGSDPSQVTRCGPLYDAPYDLATGEQSTFQDSAARLTVRVIDKSALGYRVRVTRG